jgi:hypothetical protein
MNIAKIAMTAWMTGLVAAALLGTPAPAHAQEAPSGTGKTLAAVTLASQVGADVADADDLAGAGGTVEAAQFGQPDSEWKYVPVRR